MKGLRSIRALSRDSLRGLEPAPVTGATPVFEMVDPTELFVEEGYQRGVGAAGTGLVRKIYAGFSWTRFKPPVCVRVAEFDDALVCIDGQHTAIAAASHPGIEKIPVMIVPADDAALRASAFVGHNRDRVSLTPQAIYRAELAAGDELAVAVDQACKAAGANVLDRPVNLREKHPVGSTIAIGTMKAVVKRQGEQALARALKVLVAAGRGPIKAQEVLGVAMVLAAHGEGPGIDHRLQETVASQTTEAWSAEAMGKAAKTGEPIGSALAALWCGELRLGPPQRAGKGLASASARGANALPNRRAEELREAAKIGRGEDPGQKQPLARVSPPLPPPKRPAEDPPPKPAQRPIQAVSPKPPPGSSPAPKLTSPPEGEDTVTRNGVTVTLRTGEVLHGGERTRIVRQDGLRLVAALVRVMPALLDGSRLCTKAFGSQDSERLSVLVADVNADLRSAHLEVRHVKNIGYTLAVLG